METSAKGGHAIDVTITDGGHRNHKEVHTVPVAELLAIVKIWRITGIFQLRGCQMIRGENEQKFENIFLPNDNERTC